MNATQSSVVRLADRLNAADAESVPDVAGVMAELGRRARAAARRLSLAGAEEKNAALRAMAAAIRAAAAAILAANADDVAAAKAAGQTPAFLDRLALDEARLEAVAAAVEGVAELPDPVGRVLATFERPNGLTIERVATPLGVIGVIFESRPNVAADAGALCLKAGNAAILRAGSDSFRSAAAIVAAMVEGLAARRPAGRMRSSSCRPGTAPPSGRCSPGSTATSTSSCRAAARASSRASRRRRGCRSSRISKACATSMSIGDAELEMAKRIVLNAKMRRTGVCGAAETLLVDGACAATHLGPLIGMLLDAGCAVRGDAAVRAADPRVTPAAEEDWSAEYLDAVIAARVVDGLDAAIAHVETYGSHHTDAIVTADAAAAERFLAEVDSAIVLHNASTQFADGGEFGFGAEIGIATGRMHARGPVGVEQLTSFKYRVRGAGQTRP